MNDLKKFYIFITVLFVLLSGFLGFVLAKAISTSQPTLDERYYEKGMNYDKFMLQYKEAQRQGWSLLWPDKKLKLGENHISVTLTNKQNIAIQNAHVEVELTQPAQQRFRLKTILQREGSGNAFSGKVIVDKNATWELTFIAVINDNARLVHFEKIDL